MESQWPQWTVGILMILAAIIATRVAILESRIDESGRTMAFIVSIWAWTGLYAEILHAGGFW